MNKKDLPLLQMLDLFMRFFNCD